MNAFLELVFIHQLLVNIILMLCKNPTIANFLPVGYNIIHCQQESSEYLTYEIYSSLTNHVYILKL